MWLVIVLLLAQTAGCGSGSSTKSPEPEGKKVIRELREAEPSTTSQASEAAERANLRLPAAYAARIEAVCNRFEARLLPLTDANATGRGPSRSTLASGRPLRATFYKDTKGERFSMFYAVTPVDFGRSRSWAVLAMNSHTWHGGCANQDGAPRRTIHAYFSGREHGQQLNQAEYLRVRTAERLSPAARWMLDG